jgi:hypothetical protein
LVLGLFIVKAAVQAAMEVGPTMGADFRPPNPVASFQPFAANMARPHYLLYLGKYLEDKILWIISNYL